MTGQRRGSLPLQQLMVLLAEHTAAAGTFGRTADAGALAAAAQVTEQILGHPEFDALPPDVRSSLLQLAGYVFQWRYLDLHDPADLDTSVASMARAMAAAPAHDHRRRERLVLLAESRLQQYGHDPDPTRLRDALDSFHQALVAPAAGPDLLTRVSKLGNHIALELHQRYRSDGDSGDLRLAIETYDRVRSSASVDGPERVTALTGYGDCIHDRYLREGEAADLQLAVEALEHAVAATADGDPALWKRLALWGCGLLDRYRRGGELVDLEQAIDAFGRSVAITPAGHPALPQTLSNLGGAMVRWYERSGELVDLPPAVETLRRAVALTPGGDSNLASRLNNLGASLLHLFDRGGRQVELDSALEAFRQAVRATRPDDAALPLRLANLGEILVRQYSISQDPNDLNDAVAALRQAASSTPDHTPHLVITLRGLASALCVRFARQGAAEDCEEAVSVFREACAAGLAMAAGDALEAAVMWSLWASRRAEWAEVSEAGEAGLTALDVLVEGQLTRGHKEIWLRERQGLAARTAYARAIMTPTDGGGAVVALERGRAVLLAEAMRRDGASLTDVTMADHADLVERYRGAAHQVDELEREAERRGAAVSQEWTSRRRAAGEQLREAAAAVRKIPHTPALLGTPMLAGIANAAANAPLVYVAAAESGGVACVVRPGGAVTTTLLPTLDRETLLYRVNEYRAAYLRRRADSVAWRTCLEDITAWLWESLMGPLLDTLVETTRAVLIPTGLLGLLPLHAAWTPDPASPTRRRYALDELLITYTPSAHALRRAQRVADRVTADRLLAVDEPRPVAAPPLPYSAREVQSAVDVFPAAWVLRHEQATREAVLAALSEYPVVHLSGHADARADAPLESGLLTAGYDRLTLRQVMDRRVAIRLAVLSACETAMIDAGMADEVVSLSTGLLQAGAAGVVGTLWSVPSLSTFILVARFYKQWRTAGVEPAEALRQAQRWMRDATYAELAEAFPAVAEFTRAAVPALQPFAKPYWWAGFAYTGC